MDLGRASGALQKGCLETGCAQRWASLTGIRCATHPSAARVPCLQASPRLLFKPLHDPLHDTQLEVACHSTMTMRPHLAPSGLHTQTRQTSKVSLFFYSTQ